MGLISLLRIGVPPKKFTLVENYIGLGDSDILRNTHHQQTNTLLLIEKLLNPLHMNVLALLQ